MSDQPITIHVDPSLLTVVPWSQGFAHSWALAALLTEPRTQAAIFSVLPDLPGPSPHRVEGPIVREKGVNPRRADLAFTLIDADGRPHLIAVETKVNDPFDADQVLAYRQAGWTPLLYLPASTGLLLAACPDTDAGEVRLTPEMLLSAVEASGVTFAPLLDGYLNALRSETERAGRARALVRGETTVPVGPGQTPAQVLEDVAWIAETFRALPAAAAACGVPADAEIRIERNDRGIFYSGAFVWVESDGGLWVDVIADVRTGARAIAVKAGEKDLAGAWDLAAEKGPPTGDGWRKTARKVRGDTCTVWKIDCDRTTTAIQAADIAVEAAAFTHSLGSP